MEDKRFLDDSLIIKKEQSSEDIQPWPSMSDEARQSLENMNMEAEQHEPEKQEETEQKKSKKKKKQESKKDIPGIKSRQEILLEIYNETLDKLTRKEINIHIYQRMMKKDGNNDTRKRYLQLIENTQADIRELREMTDVVKGMLKEHGEQHA